MRGEGGRGRGTKKATRGTNAAGLQPPLLRELDSNERPPGYEPGELPTAPPRDVFVGAKVQQIVKSEKRNAKNYLFFSSFLCLLAQNDAVCAFLTR